jgi:hypothetical protein
LGGLAFCSWNDHASFNPVASLRRATEFVIDGSEEKLRMGPGQLKPNDFELAILERIATDQPSIRVSMQQLHVLSREFTGVGSFTTFRVDGSVSGAPERRLGLDSLINMPGVPKGMGAVLFCKGDQPECLEVFTFGDDHWDGVYDGFSIERTA